MSCTAGCGDLDAVEGGNCPDCSALLEVLLGECSDCCQETESPHVTQCDDCSAYYRHQDDAYDRMVDRE